jgi:hypothetical protein
LPQAIVTFGRPSAALGENGKQQQCVAMAWNRA